MSDCRCCGSAPGLSAIDRVTMPVGSVAMVQDGLAKSNTPACGPPSMTTCAELPALLCADACVASTPISPTVSMALCMMPSRVIFGPLAEWISSESVGRESRFGKRPSPAESRICAPDPALLPPPLWGSACLEGETDAGSHCNAENGPNKRRGQIERVRA